MSAERNAEIAALYRDGCTYVEIAERLHVSCSTVQRAINSAGIAVHRRGPNRATPTKSGKPRQGPELKVTISFSLAPATIAKLKLIATRDGLSASRVVELLIDGAEWDISGIYVGYTWDIH